MDVLSEYLLPSTIPPSSLPPSSKPPSSMPPMASILADLSDHQHPDIESKKDRKCVNNHGVLDETQRARTAVFASSDSAYVSASCTTPMILPYENPSNSKWTPKCSKTSAFTASSSRESSRNCEVTEARKSCFVGANVGRSDRKNRISESVSIGDVDSRTTSEDSNISVALSEFTLNSERNKYFKITSQDCQPTVVWCKRKLVVIVVDGTDTGDKALDYYLENLHKQTYSLSFIHIIAEPSISFYEEIPPQEHHSMLLANLEKAKNFQEQYQFRLFQEGIVSSSKFVRSGHKSGARTLTILTQLGADLVIVGPYGMGRFRSTDLGRVGRYLIQHSHIPVTVCPPQHSKSFSSCFVRPNIGKRIHRNIDLSLESI